MPAHPHEHNYGEAPRTEKQQPERPDAAAAQRVTLRARTTMR